MFAADPTCAIKDVASDVGVSYVLTADFNRDSIADIGTLGSPGVAVQLGNGDGTFRAPVGTAIGADSNTVVAGDVNGDGIPDVVTGGDQLTVLLGNGDGSFHAGTTLTGSSPGLADFNRDGKLDLAFVASGTVHIALGNGDGTFGSPKNVGPSSLFGSVGPLITGDFDGDGIGDIAFADCCDPQTDAAPIGHLYVLYGDGAGGIANTYSEQSAAVAYLRNIDFNKDSMDDFAESWSGCHTPCMGLTVHLGNSARQPQSLTDIQEPTFDNFVPGPAVAADFNSDGRNDIAFSDTDFFPQDVGATSTNAVFVSLQQNDGSPAVTPLVFEIGSTVSAPDNIATADFNRDGKPDLVTIKGQGTLAVLLNTTGGTSGSGAGSAADFSLSALPQQISLSAGTSATATVSVTGTGGFDGAVALTCSGLPTGASCTFDPATVNAGATSTLTIATTGTTASVRPIRGPILALWLPVIGLVFAGASGLTRKKVFLLFVVIIVSLLLLQACGGDGSQNTFNRGGTTGGGNNNGGSGGGSNVTTPGEYQVTITGTSGSLQRTTAITLTVQ